MLVIAIVNIIANATMFTIDVRLMKCRLGGVAQTAAVIERDRFNCYRE